MMPLWQTWQLEAMSMYSNYEQIERQVDGELDMIIDTLQG
jgi:hypothetical protein